MLALRTFDGVDLVANSPTPVALKATTASGLLYTLQVLAVEDDVTLPTQQVRVVVDWSDGQQPVTYPYALSSSGTNTVNALRTLGLGDHVIRIEAENLRAPQPDISAVNFEVTVLPRLQFGTPAKLIFGPILPKDSGFPNAQQWNFNTGSDGEILDSSVKMLLSTAKGERIMLPEYGTDLRTILFEPITEGMQEMAEQRIVDALNRWEPRVSLQSVTVTRNMDSSITITCILISKLTRQDFTTTVVFNP